MSSGRSDRVLARRLVQLGAAAIVVIWGALRAATSSSRIAERAADLRGARRHGAQVVGRHVVRRGGRVLHIDFEMGQRLVCEKYQRLARGKAIKPDELRDRLEVASLPGLRLDQDGAESLLAAKCEGFTLCIVDSLRAAAPTLEENSSEFRNVLDMLTRISESTECVFLVIHHARKPSDGTNGATYSVRGSSAIFDGCQSVLVFEGAKNEPTKVEHEKARVGGVTVDRFELQIKDIEIGGDARGGLAVVAHVQDNAPDMPPNFDPAASEKRARLVAAAAANENITARHTLYSLAKMNSNNTAGEAGVLFSLGVLVNEGGRIRLSDTAAAEFEAARTRIHEAVAYQPRGGELALQSFASVSRREIWTSTSTPRSPRWWLPGRRRAPRRGPVRHPVGRDDPRERCRRVSDPCIDCIRPYRPVSTGRVRRIAYLPLEGDTHVPLQHASHAYRRRSATIRQRERRELGHDVLRRIDTRSARPQTSSSRLSATFLDRLGPAWAVQSAPLWILRSAPRTTPKLRPGKRLARRSIAVQIDPTMYSPFSRDVTLRLLAPFLTAPEGLSIAQMAAIVYADKEQDGYLLRSCAGNLGKAVRAGLLDRLGDGYSLTDQRRATLADLQTAAPPETPRARRAPPLPERDDAPDAAMLDALDAGVEPPAAPSGQWMQGAGGLRWSSAPDGSWWSTPGAPAPPRCMVEGYLFKFSRGKVIARRQDAWGRPLDARGRLLEPPPEPPPAPLPAPMPVAAPAPAPTPTYPPTNATPSPQDAAFLHRMRVGLAEAELVSDRAEKILAGSRPR